MKAGERNRDAASSHSLSLWVGLPYFLPGVELGPSTTELCPGPAFKEGPRESAVM